MESLKTIFLKEKKYLIGLKVLILLFSLLFSLWCNIGIFSLSLPYISLYYFPIYKSYLNYVDNITKFSFLLDSFFATMAISGITIIVLTALIVIKNKNYFHFPSLSTCIINIFLIPFIYFISSPPNGTFLASIYYYILQISYFDYNKTFLLFSVFIFILTVLLLILIIVPIINSFSNTETSKKFKTNININLLGVLLLIAIIAANSILKEPQEELSKVKGIELFNPKDQKWLLYVDWQGKPNSVPFENYFVATEDPLKVKYALNKNNLELIQNLQANKFPSHYFGPYYSYILRFYENSYNLSDFDNFCITGVKRNVMFYTLEQAFLSVTLKNRVNQDKKSLKILESMYHDKSMHISDKSKCTLSLIQYKLGKLKEAKENSNYIKVNNEEYDLCDYTKKLLAGNIKKTSLKGQLVSPNNSVKGLKVFTAKPNWLEGYLPFLSSTDLTETDSKGRFTLYAQTDEPIYLVVESKEPKKISYDYKKLQNYKQGSTVNLGKVILY